MKKYLQRNFYPLAFSIVPLLMLAASPAHASDWYVDTKVGVVEADYMPGWIAFTITSAGGSCAAGAFLNYYAQGSTASDKQANVTAVLATLLTAQAANRTVRIYGNNSGCTVTNIWLYSS